MKKIFFLFLLAMSLFGSYVFADTTQIQSVQGINIGNSSYQPIQSTGANSNTIFSKLNSYLGTVKNVYGSAAPAHPAVVVLNIINIILGFLGIIGVVLVVYAGFLWMTAAGSEDQITKSKQIMLSAVIGLVIVLSAYAVTSFILLSFSQAVSNSL